MSRRRRRQALVAAGLAALVAIVVLTLRPNPELEALKADPLARWQPPAAGGTLEPLVRAQEQGSPSVEFIGVLPGLGDREPALYERTFHVPQEAGLEPFEAARRAAEDAGWRLDYPSYVTADSPDTQTWTTVMGYKELPTGTAVVHIQTDAARPTRELPPRTNILVVLLEHTR
jgi:hypothetical protein